MKPIVINPKEYVKYRFRIDLADILNSYYDIQLVDSMQLFSMKGEIQMVETIRDKLLRNEIIDIVLTKEQTIIDEYEVQYHIITTNDNNRYIAELTIPLELYSSNMVTWVLQIPPTYDYSIYQFNNHHLPYSV